MDRVDGRPQASSLGHYLGIVRRRWWVVLLVIIVAVGLAAFSLMRSAPSYQAQASLLRLNANFDQALFQVQVFQSPDPARDLQTGSDLIKTDAVAQLAQTRLKTQESSDDLLKQVSVSSSPATDIITVTASGTDAGQAAAVANAFAAAFVDYRRWTNQALLNQAKKDIDSELADMSNAEKASPQGTALIQRSQDLGVLASIENGGYTLVQTAKAPTAAVSPRPTRTLALALVLGIVFGVLLALASYFFDRRVKDERALEGALMVPVLASLPPLGRRGPDLARGVRTGGLIQLRSQQFEPYRTLRSNLKHIASENGLHSLLVTSALPREGKTGTCVNLALSLALAGSRVILIEADMRQPVVHAFLGLRNDAGLSDLLLGRYSLNDVLQRVALEDPAAPDEGRSGGLFCLTSGFPPPNPSELLDSVRMRQLVETASAQADYVLIDTPPVLVVSDALGFAKYVDGAMLAARINSTRTDDVIRARDTLERSGARLIGVVATGVKDKRHLAGRYAFSYNVRTQW